MEFSTGSCSTSSSQDSSDTVTLAGAPESIKAMEPCKVCGARISVTKTKKSYGVRTCEGCRNFFSRHAERQYSSVYKCLKGENCPVTTQNRSECIECRLKKCFEMGMRKKIATKKEKCVVCDKMKGEHMGKGVNACGNCKRFFGRNVSKNIPKCKLGGNCKISNELPKKCSACRFQKCIMKGMKKEGSSVSSVSVPTVPQVFDKQDKNQITVARTTVPKSKPNVKLENHLQYSPARGFEVHVTPPRRYEDLGTGTPQASSSSKAAAAADDLWMDWTTIPQEESVGHVGTNQPSTSDVFDMDWDTVAHEDEMMTQIFDQLKTFPPQSSNETNMCQGTVPQGEGYWPTVSQLSEGEGCSSSTSANFRTKLATVLQEQGHVPTVPQSFDEDYRPSSTADEYYQVCHEDPGTTAHQPSDRSHSTSVNAHMYPATVPQEASVPCEEEATGPHDPHIIQEALTPSNIEVISHQIIDAHGENWSYSTDETSLRKPKPYSMHANHSDPYINRLNAWQKYAHKIEKDIRQTVNFLRSLTRLDELHFADKTLLFRNSYLSIFLLRMYPGISGQGLLLHSGRLVDEPTLNLLYGQDLVKKLMKLADEARSMRFDDDEIALFVTLVLCRHGQANFRNPSKVLEVCSYYTAIVEECVDKDTLMCFEVMILWMTEIKELHEPMLDFVRDNHKLLNLPPMFMDCFEIERQEGELNNNNNNVPTTSTSQLNLRF